MASTPFICTRCIRAQRLNTLFRMALRQTRRRPVSRSSSSSASSPLHATSSRRDKPQDAAAGADTAQNTSRPPEAGPDPELGPMARRLQQATEDALLSGGRAGRRAIEDAGFSDELKAKLLDKVAAANFHAEHSAALAQADLASRIPDSAGLGTRAMASAQPWAGQESTEDAVLRMLDDARKPLGAELRGKGKPSVPQPVDMRLRREVRMSPGRRAAGARDKAHAYAGIAANDKGLSNEEREAMKREFRERFAPGARAMPNTVAGLAALANERIEDAIARGQFKNIPRGKGVERDTRADSPFIDTTEYIMNKMIKRQDMVPPWIEKQQDLVKAAENFRGRVRYEWKRHASRMIATRGGTLEQQIARATAHAHAEQRYNPRRRNPEHMSVPTNSTDGTLILQSTPQPSSTPAVGEEEATPDQAPTLLPSHPFRDPAWEAAESAYMNLAIANLNALTRSYNLMAPELAKKPYFSLERELRNCYADVAPHVAGEIRARATRPAKSLVGNPFGGLAAAGGLSGGGARGGGAGGLFSGGGMGSGVSVAEGREKQYGMKEFWRDLWGKGE